MNRKELTITNQLQEVDKLYPFVQEIGHQLNIDVSLINSINLALEEALVNVVEYAYKDGTGKITLSAEYIADTGTLVFALSDSGVAFNPLEHPEADTTLSLEEREIGGLGIFLIKEIMDRVEYCRKDGENILTMYKILPRE